MPTPRLTPDQINQIKVIITDVLGLLIDPRQHYPADLPADIAPWYCYPRDSGHSLLVILASTLQQAPTPDDLTEYLVPAPVKAVLRAGYTVTNEGFPVTDLPYDPDLGLLTTPYDDDEY